MNLTPEQAGIVASDATNIFVSAAAGSGKTRLLVERYLRGVVDDGLRPAQLPTVTFTRKAAGEIRQRIRRGLLAVGRHDIAWALDDAPIGTIHSLCSRVLRSQTLAADVDPAFAVLEEDQSDIIAAEAFALAWEDLVRASSLPERVLLARHRSLFLDVRAAYATMRQEGVENPTLSVPELPDVTAARDSLLAVLAEVCSEFAGAGLKGLAAQNLEKANRCSRWAAEAQATWADLAFGAAFTPHLGCGAKTKESFTRVKAALVSFRDALAGRYLADVLSLADSLLRGHHLRYVEAKRARGVMDFADLELKTRRLLEAGVRPFGDGARLMVDEFQDTNGLQCAILERLGTGGTLTVGDPFQSIYGFRGADVEVFRARQAALCAESTPQTLVGSLSVNFRSSEPLLRVLNHMFGSTEFFGPDFPTLVAPVASEQEAGPRSSAEGVRGGAPLGLPPPPVGPAVQVVVVEAPASMTDDDSCVEPADDGGNGEGGEGAPSAGAVRVWDAEAAAVAERVAEMLASGRSPREVVVLLRAFTHVGEFERALRSRDIPVYVVQGRGFFAREEFQDVRALLRLVVNPHDDPALVTVLRSPVVGLPDDVALMLRMDASQAGLRFLWEVIREGRFDRTAAEYHRPLQRVAGLLDGLRSRLGAPGLAGLLEDALDAFDYDLAILRSDDGRRRFANVRKLMRLATEFEALEGPDLEGFLRYLDVRGNLSGDREAGASILSEEEDVVRVMTIHQAKGLEFPVVVLAGMGSTPARGRGVRSLECSRGRVALRVAGPSGKPNDRLTLGPHDQLREEADLKNRQESDRLHYVAATRAEERLVLVGAVGSGCPPPPQTPLAAVLRSLGVSAEQACADGEIRPVDSLDLTVERVRTDGGRQAGAAAGRSVLASAETRRFEAAGTGGGVVAPPFPDGRLRGPGVRHTSFSALHRYEECPRAYYLERAVQSGHRLPDAVASEGPPASEDRVASEDPAARLFGDREWDEVGADGSDDGGALARAIGTYVHAVLEYVSLAGRPHEEEVLALLSGSIRGLAPLAVGARARAARLALAFWDSSYSGVAASERAFRERAFRFAHEGVIVSGFMDLAVDVGEGRWLVLDYKTNRLDAIDPAAAFVPYELQSRLYGIAALLAGASEVEVVFLFLERPTEPVVRIYRPDDLPVLRVELSRRLAGPSAREFPKRTSSCDVCGLTSLCRSLAD